MQTLDYYQENVSIWKIFWKLFAHTEKSPYLCNRKQERYCL